MTLPRSLLDLWLSLATAALLLFSGMPKLECCCVDGGEQTGSCCGSGSSEKRSPAFGGCGCDPAGDCDCDHDLGGPQDLPPEDPGGDWNGLAAAPPIELHEGIALPVLEAVKVGDPGHARASPPPLFLLHCAFRC